MEGMGPGSGVGAMAGCERGGAGEGCYASESCAVSPGIVEWLLGVGCEDQSMWRWSGRRWDKGGVTQVRTLSLMYLLNASRYFP